MIIPKIKTKKETGCFIQAKVDAEIAMRARAIIERYGFHWKDVLEACLESFVEEIEHNEKLKTARKGKK